MKYVSLKSLSCQAGPALVGINFNASLFYPFIFSVNMCSGSCNTIDYPFAGVCVPNKVKNMNVKLFNIKSRTNEPRFLVQHESVCNSSKNGILMYAGVCIYN